MKSSEILYVHIFFHIHGKENMIKFKRDWAKRKREREQHNNAVGKINIQIGIKFYRNAKQKSRCQTMRWYYHPWRSFKNSEKENPNIQCTMAISFTVHTDAQNYTYTWKWIFRIKRMREKARFKLITFSLSARWRKNRITSIFFVPAFPKVNGFMSKIEWSRLMMQYGQFSKYFEYI